MKSQITGIDWAVIGLYFGILLCVATWVVRKGKDSASDYFLAGRNLHLGRGSARTKGPCNLRRSILGGFRNSHVRTVLPRAR